MGVLSGIRDDFGVVACMVGGGRDAVARTQQPHIKAVVAVACETELVQGIWASFPKPVLGVVNATPEGPCKNTLANPNEVIKAIESLTRKRT